MGKTVAPMLSLCFILQCIGKHIMVNEIKDIKINILYQDAPLFSKDSPMTLKLKKFKR